MAIDSPTQSRFIVNYLEEKQESNSSFPQEKFEAYLQQQHIKEYDLQPIEDSHMAYLTLVQADAESLQKKLLTQKFYSIRELSPKTDYIKLKSNVDLVEESVIALSGLALLIVERLGILPSILLLSGQLTFMGISLAMFILLLFKSASYIKQIREGKRVALNYIVLFVIWSGWLFSTLMVLQAPFFLSIGLLPFFSLPVITLGCFGIGNYLDEAQINKIIKRWCDIVNVKISNIMSQAIFKYSPESQDFQTIKLEQIKQGDLIAVPPGCLIPVRGKLVEMRGNKIDQKTLNGESKEKEIWTVDESVISGESTPIEKNVDDELFGSSKNVSKKTLYFTATNSGDKSKLYQKICNLENFVPDKKEVKESDSADRIPLLFIFLQVIVLVATALLWFYLGPAPVIPYMVIHCLSVLICACPCSLALAQLLPIYTSRTFLSNKDILIKEDRVFRKLNTIEVVVFDKTGTLTDPAKIEVKEFKCFKHTELELSEEKLVQLVASLERPHAGEGNDYAKSFLKYAKKRNITKYLEAKEEKNGEKSPGIRASVDGYDVAIGPKSFIKEIVENFDEIEETKEISTGSFIAVNEKLVGWVDYSHQLRDQAKTAITQLNKRGLTVLILSGDNKKNVDAVAKELNLASENIIAEVKAKEKEGFIGMLRKNGFRVVMVGDGINDEEAFAQASIGCAISSEAAAVGKEDIILNGNLLAVPRILCIAETTHNKIYINVGVLLLANFTAMLIAAGVLYLLLGVMLIPTITSILSTLLSGVAVGVTWINREKLKNYLKGMFESAKVDAELNKVIDTKPETASLLRPHPTVLELVAQYKSKLSTPEEVKRDNVNVVPS